MEEFCDDKLNYLKELATNNNINVGYVDLDIKYGFSFVLDNKKYIGINSKIKNTFLEVETLAHELGHCFTEAFCFLNDTEDIRSKCETTANLKALEILSRFNN